MDPRHRSRIRHEDHVYARRSRRPGIGCANCPRRGDGPTWRSNDEMFSYCFTVYFDGLSVLDRNAVEIDKTVGDLALDTRDLQSVQDDAGKRHFDMCLGCDGCFIAVLVFDALV